jgi:hypothetical protein
MLNKPCLYLCSNFIYVQPHPEKFQFVCAFTYQ